MDDKSDKNHLSLDYLYQFIYYGGSFFIFL